MLASPSGTLWVSATDEGAPVEEPVGTIVTDKVTLGLACATPHPRAKAAAKTQRARAFR
jgi:hypothetical protein